jgi:hypothetical protein
MSMCMVLVRYLSLSHYKCIHPCVMRATWRASVALNAIRARDVSVVMASVFGGSCCRRSCLCAGDCCGSILSRWAIALPGRPLAAFPPRRSMV